MIMDKKRIYNLLYEWIIEDNCNYCKHYTTFYYADKRHPCNRCEDYRLFSISDALKKDLNDKVKQIIETIKIDK